MISQLANSVQDKVDNLLSNGVMSTSVVVGGILFSSDQLFRVEQLAVSSSSDFIHDSGFQVHKNSSGNVFSSAGFREKGVEGVIASSNSLVRGHLTVRLDAMFKTVKLPTGVTDLAASLANMDRDTFTLKKKSENIKNNVPFCIFKRNLP